MLKVLERGYPDIERQDSSKELRNGFRAFWAEDENLWDVDLNNNFLFMDWWLTPHVDLRREPSPPFRHEGSYQTIVPSGTYKDHIGFFSVLGLQYLPPVKGAMVFIRQDQMYVSYSGSAWKPMLYLPDWPRTVEIAIFASKPAPSSILASHVVEEPFTIPASGRGSRARNIHEEVQLYIMRNGVQIGIIEMADSFGRISLNADTSFVAGDILSVVTPGQLKGSRAISISLLGYLP